MVCSVYKLKKRGEGGDQQSAGITEYMIKRIVLSKCIGQKMATTFFTATYNVFSYCSSFWSISSSCK